MLQGSRNGLSSENFLLFKFGPGFDACRPNGVEKFFLNIWIENLMAGIHMKRVVVIIARIFFIKIPNSTFCPNYKIPIYFLKKFYPEFGIVSHPEYFINNEFDFIPN